MSTKMNRLRKLTARVMSVLFASGLALALPDAHADEVLFCSGFETTDCQIAGDEQAPLFLDAQPSELLVAPGSIPTVGVLVVEERSGIDPGSLRFFHDDVDVSSEVTLDGLEVRYALASPPAAGEHHWRIQIRDLAGNEGTHEWRYLVTTVPGFSGLAPEEIRVDAADVRVQAQISDAIATLDVADVGLWLDEEPVDVAGSVNVVGARELALDWSPAQPLAPGRHTVLLRVRNNQGGYAHANWGFWVLDEPVYELDFLNPESAAVVLDAEIRVAVSAASNRADVTSVLVNGEMAGIDADDDGRVFFARDLRLAPGVNSIQAVVGFSDGETRTLTRDVTYDAPPRIQVTEPLDFQTFGPGQVAGKASGNALNLTGDVAHAIRIAGTSDRPVVRVEINQQLASLNSAGTEFWFDNYFLHEGTNVLTVIAFADDGRTSTSTVTAYVDHTAPLLLIEGPATDTVSSSQRIDVRGSVTDAVSGLIGTPEPVVLVHNRANAQTVSASVYQSFFLAQDVPLEVGANVLDVTATDGAGNLRSAVLTINRVAVGSERVVIYSGNRQSATLDSELPMPLEVHVLDASGLPKADAPVRFDILRGDGRLSSEQGVLQTADGITPARNRVVPSDAQGVARIWLRVGSESGLAANVVRAQAEGIVEEVLFTASGQRGTPAWVMPDGSAGTQFAEANSRAIEPLSVVVYDAKRNRVEGSVLEYQVVEGDAVFDLQSSPGGIVSDEGRTLRTFADRNGSASARPVLGPNDGNVRIAVRAVDHGDAASATFNLLVMAQGTGETSFTGTVLDHTGVPLPGVRLWIDRANLTTTTDSEGVFRFDAQVPPGKIDLMVDGRLAPAPPGLEYPSLHFETAVIRGRENQLPHAIYLPPVNRSQEKVVGGDQDVTLTIPGFEGFELIVKANSVTFPDGSRIGPVVLSAVNADRLPMVPTGGSASFGPIAWTLQPSKTRFDPPIEVRIPNTGGLRPGETTTIVQWDHDLSTFVPMGLGAVNEDATQIVTIAGSGITKAGWGGCTGDCPPPPPNCGASSDEPTRPAYQNIRAYNLRVPFFGFHLYSESVELDRISKNHPVRYKDKTYRVEDGWIFDGKCDWAEYEWLFGDGGSGYGDVVDHEYELRGATTLRETIVCHYQNQCDGTPASVRWPKDFPIRLRDTEWIEYREAMDECGWTPSCWLIYRAQEELAGVSHLMGQIEIEWLTDLRDWNRETIDLLGPGSGQSLGSGKIATLALLHAANETVFPTSILDVVPIGKATKALKLIRGRYGASVDELAEISEDIVTTCGRTNGLDDPDAIFSSNACLLGWQRFELQGIGKVEARLCGGGCARSWQPVRNANNGFDGAVVWRDPNGNLQLAITESKMWAQTTDPVVASNLTAFGLGANPGTLQNNIDIVIRDLRNDGVPGASAADIEDLIERISGQPRQFDVFIHVLHENRLDWSGISSAISNITGRAPIQIAGW